MPCYTGEKTQDETCEMIKEKMKSVVEFMQNRGGEAILGNSNLCYLDFYLFEFLLFCEFITREQIYEWYPILRQYKYYMAELPYLSSYLESEDPAVTTYPFNMRFAMINNWKKPHTEEIEEGADEDASLNNPYGMN